MADSERKRGAANIVLASLRSIPFALSCIMFGLAVIVFVVGLLVPFALFCCSIIALGAAMLCVWLIAAVAACVVAIPGIGLYPPTVTQLLKDVAAHEQKAEKAKAEDKSCRT